MTDTTPAQHLPYPEATDPVADYPTVAKQMAEMLDLILPPVGAILAYAGRSAPTGWFLCDGSTFDPDQYPTLAAVLNGMTVPNLTDKFIRGGTNIGATGGAATVTLTESQMPWHGHGVSDPGHIHGWMANYIGESAGMYHRYTDRMSGGDANHNMQYTVGTHSAGTGISIHGAGGGQAHENMPPYFTLAYIIRHGGN